MVNHSLDEIQEAQSRRIYTISGKEYSRVAYGDESEDWGADRHPCHDCQVLKGQLHVIGCDAERCPVCGCQAIDCECRYEGDEDSNEQ